MSYNRRMGDGPRGNRSFSQPFQSGPVSPWQGGSSANQGGILSQLTSNPQLALALTSLLQPQQQQPPSLLSLNTSPAFSDRGDYGRFSSLNRGREFRRPEPYYKSRGFGDRRRRSPRRDKKNDKKPGDKKSDKSDKSKEDGDVSMEDEEGKESKRDWKDEKNQAEGKDEEGDEGKKEGEKEGRYGGVPRKYLNCFVCNKQMWDGESMGKHIRGRAHQEMMKALEESIHICVNILRENMRLIEDRKVIEWNRQNRLKKYGKRHRESELSHCNMCDLKFMGKIVVHRRTTGHQRLKNYLHPKCKVCDKEFPARLEWIDHRLTPEHMRNLHKAVETDTEPADGQTITEGDGEDLNLEPLLDENLQMESEDCILELDDPLNDLQNRLPAYKPDRAVATQILKDFTGWMCELCNRSFASEEDSQNHLKTRRHFYRFVEVLKEKFEEKERKEKAEKEAAEKKKKEEEKKKAEEAENGKENGVKEGDGEEEGDVEMYDPAETTEEKENGEEVEDEEKEDVKIEATEEEEEQEEEEEEEKEPEPPKKEVKKETPPTPAKTPAKKLAGPKSRRGKK